MWLNSFIKEVQELEMDLSLVLWDLELYEKLNTELLAYGRDFLLEKYKHNLTYVYKLLNSNILQETHDRYDFIKKEFDHKQLTLEMISVFHPDKKMIPSRFYENTEIDQAVKFYILKNHPLG